MKSLPVVVEKCGNNSHSHHEQKIMSKIEDEKSKKQAFFSLFKTRTMKKVLPLVVTILLVIGNLARNSRIIIFDVQLFVISEKFRSVASSDIVNNNNSNNDKTIMKTTTTTATATATATTSTSTPESSCNGYDGILHIRAGDRYAAGATVLFMYVINYIIYAERHNLIPFIHFDGTDTPLAYTHQNSKQDYFVANPLNIELKSKKVVNPIPVILRNNGSECWNNDGTDLLPLAGPPSSFIDGDNNSEGKERTNINITGHGIWRSYFHPVSTFDWDDPSCSSLPVIRFPAIMITTLHECDPNSVRSWVYDRMPNNLRPHEASWGSNDDSSSMVVRPTIHDWLGQMREKGATIVKKYFRLLPWLQSKIDKVVESFGDEKDCLGMHIRHTDKGAGRQKVPIEAFLPYAEAYIHAGGKCIFLATDSETAWSEISRVWPLPVVRRIVVQEGAFRSSNNYPTFVQKDSSRIITEILTDLYAMSRCSFLVHGFSAVSEAAIYLNPTLHNNSVNLDYGKDFAPTPDKFRGTVSDRLNQRPSPVEASELKLCFNYSMVPHDYVLQNNSFLPDPTTSSCYDDGDDFKAEHLSFDIYEKQNPDSCVASNQLYISGKDNFFTGFGSTINSWVKPFMYALDNKLQFWSPGLGTFSSGKEKTLIHGTHCGVNSTSCWFEEVTPCKRKKKLGDSRDIRRMDPRSLVAIRDTYSLLHRGSDINGYPAMIPPEYRRMGLFWYYSHLLAYLLRPNYDFRRHLETIKKNMNWDALEGPVLSLHIRHGDACIGYEPKKRSRKCDGLSTYMERVFPVAKRYGVQSIFLSTDDQEVIDNTSNYTEFTWLYQELDTSSRGVIEWDFIEESNLSTFKLVQEALIDIFLLAEGDIFVGKFTSNVDRIAYSLMTARKNGLAPYLSLDSSWCFDWGVKSGKSLYGKFDC